MKKLYLILTLLIGFSCSDDALISKKSIDADQFNTLKFKDTSEILSFVKGITENSGNINGRTTNDGFESFDEVYKKAVTELSDAKTIEEHSSLLKVYDDVLSLSDSSYVPKINNYLYRTICNRDRLYESNGYVHKVFDDQFIIFTEKENAGALRKISSLDNLDTGTFRVIKYQDFNLEQNNARALEACGASQKVDYFDNNGKCSDDRRVYIRAYTSYAISGYTYRPTAISEAWGEIRNWLCNWKQYKTILRTRNCSLNVFLTINGGSLDFPYQFVDYSGTTEEYEHILLQGNLLSGSGEIQWNGGTIPTITFSRIHEEATSRGVGYTNWAVIDCQ